MCKFFRRIETHFSDKLYIFELKGMTGLVGAEDVERDDVDDGRSEQSQEGESPI